MKKRSFDNEVSQFNEQKNKTPRLFLGSHFMTNNKFDTKVEAAAATGCGAGGIVRCFRFHSANFFKFMHAKKSVRWCWSFLKDDIAYNIPCFSFASAKYPFNCLPHFVKLFSSFCVSQIFGFFYVGFPDMAGNNLVMFLLWVLFLLRAFTAYLRVAFVFPCVPRRLVVLYFNTWLLGQIMQSCTHHKHIHVFKVALFSHWSFVGHYGSFPANMISRQIVGVLYPASPNYWLYFRVIVNNFLNTSENTWLSSVQCQELLLS